LLQVGCPGWQQEADPLIWPQSVHSATFVGSALACFSACLQPICIAGSPKNRIIAALWTIRFMVRISI
jgi:hypothetical protein